LHEVAEPTPSGPPLARPERSADEFLHDTLVLSCGYIKGIHCREPAGRRRADTTTCPDVADAERDTAEPADRDRISTTDGFDLPFLEE
jgi:hypothetical protein